MIRLRHKLFVYALRVFDPVILAGTLLLVIDLLEPNSRAFERVLWDAYRPVDTLGITVVAFGWVMVFNAVVHYDPDRFTALTTELANVVKATCAAAFLLVIVSTICSFGRITNQAVLIFWAVSTVAIAGSRVAARGLLRAVRRSGYNYRHLIIVGANAHARSLADRLERLPELGYKIVGFVSESPSADRDALQSARPTLGGLSDIRHLLESQPVDELLLCLPVRAQIGVIFETVQLARELGVVARLVPDPAGRDLLTRFQIEQFDGDTVVTLFREQLLLQLLGKRLLDASLSLVLLVGLSPLLLAVAAAIKLTSPGPVLFVQRRVGMNRRTFNLYKFRSMYVDAEERRRTLAHLNEMDGPVFKITNDPRVTPLGRLIRTASIDELPQLLNVLRGQMSLVGPRPPLPSEVEQYEWLYRRRLSIKPGITCLWQISGRNHVSFKQWMEFDRQYIDNWSLWLDIKILARTVPAVLSLRGAS